MQEFETEDDLHLYDKRYGREFIPAAWERFDGVLQQFKKGATYEQIQYLTSVMAMSIRTSGEPDRDLASKIWAAYAKEKRKIAGFKIVPIRIARRLDSQSKMRGYAVPEETHAQV